jgi:ectoine hydroxylase-related dioxygenase (phytanoyl-CoA dioxygenase family)
MNLFQQKSAQFQSDGYAIFDDLFPKEDFLAFRCVLKVVIREALNRAKNQGEEIPQLTPGCEIEEGLIVLRKINPSFAAFVQRVISRSPEFFRLSSNPEVAKATRSLLGLKENSPLYLLSNGVILTFPNDAANKTSSNFALAWHKDIFFTIPKSQYVHIWVPLLYDATLEIGTLKVIPGSHKEGIGKQKIDINTAYNYRYSLDPESVKEVEAKSVEVKLGQALIFDYRLAHRSGENISDRVRCTMLGLMHNASNPDFLPVSTHYAYYGQTPEAYFAEIFDNEDARKIALEQAAPVGEPKGGV